MSEEIIEDMLEEVAPQVAGDYPEIAQRYKAGEELTDEELDTIADVAISILRSILSHFDAANSPIDEYEGDFGCNGSGSCCSHWASRTYPRCPSGYVLAAGEPQAWL